MRTSPKHYVIALCGTCSWTAVEYVSSEGAEVPVGRGDKSFLPQRNRVVLLGDLVYLEVLKEFTRKLSCVLNVGTSQLGFRGSGLLLLVISRYCL